MGKFDIVKLIARILFVCFIGLAVCPTSNLIASKLTPLCNVMCSNEDDSCKKDTDCCPIGMCNSCQCCYCYFSCPVDAKKILISVFENGTENNFPAMQFALSEYHPTLLQPPREA